MAPASHSWAQERGFVRWAGALVLTLTLHGAALAAGLMRWEQAEPPIATPAAIMMELAPLPTAPPTPETRAMPEPRLPQPQPAPLAEPEPEPEPQPPVATLPIPPIDPVPASQREPDAVLPKPAPEKPKSEKPKIEQAAEKPRERPKEKPKDKPKEQARSKPTPDTKPDAEQVAARDSVPQPAQLQAAMAAPVRQAAVAAAPSAAETARRASAEANWQGLLLAHLEKHKKYPKSAQRRNQQGTPFLLIRMDRSGNVLSYALKRSSGVEVLDEEVLDLVARAEPLPPLPLEMPQAVMEVVVPVRFALK